MSRQLWWTPLCVSLLFLGLEYTAPQGSKAEELNKILDRFEEAQQSVQTLKADFTIEKESLLLNEPLLAKGQFYYRNPEQMLWDYDQPYPSKLLIVWDKMLSYCPHLEKAEEVDIGGYKERVMKYVGLGQSASKIRRDFKVELQKEDDGGAYVLKLLPKKKQLASHINRVLIWVDRSHYLPVRVAYYRPDSTYTIFSMTSVEINATLPPDIFEIHFPEGVEIDHTSDGFFLFSGFGP